MKLTSALITTALICVATAALATSNVDTKASQPMQVRPVLSFQAAPEAKPDLKAEAVPVAALEPAAGKPGNTVVQVPAEGIQVEINKGKMVRLSRNAASVVVADPSIADIQVVSPRLVYVQAKKIGETSLYAVDSKDSPILDTTVEVTHNISKLTRAIKDVVPNADVTIRTTDSGLVLGGYADSVVESDHIRSVAETFLGQNQKLVNMITTAGSDQVTLLVKVAEVSRNDLKRFGIHMENVFNTGNFAFSLFQGRDFTGTGGAFTRFGSDNSISGTYNGGRLSAQSAIDALHTDGLISVLAEPNLTTTSGRSANFLAGGEFPIPMVDSEGKVSVEYKPFGISLNFTPTVLSGNKISLNVAPEVSSISQVDSLTISNTTQFAIPSIQTRRAETTVELGSGQTFAIAGLLKNDRSNSIDKFPGLGDLPVLGALFRSQEFRNDQSELVILVTPIIVKPVSDRNAMRSPLDGYQPPNDLERMLVGKLFQEQAVAGAGTNNQVTPPADAPRLQGQGGFLLE